MRIRATSQTKGEIHEPKPLVAVMNFVVLVLAVVLIVWISYDTFNQTDLLASHEYMTFQFWVCIVFVLDFFVELAYSRHKWRHFWHRIVFLLLSIPYLNIISLIHIPLGPDGLYFIRFVPLARGALALALVMGYNQSVHQLSFDNPAGHLFLLADLLSAESRCQSNGGHILDGPLVVGHEHDDSRM